MKRVFVVFSDAQAAYAARHELFSPGELAALESEVSAAAGGRRPYARDGVRIYWIA